jgi:pimeloyl-ACP methyl ester carboxylesterase
VILLPGLDGTGRRLSEFTHCLAPDVTTEVLAYPFDRCLGYAELEDLVRAALPTHVPYVLMAESFSGPLAIRIAAQPPAGLVGLILCASFAKNPRPLLGWAHPLTQYVPIKSLPRWLRAPLLWGSTSARAAPSASERACARVDEAVLRHRLAAVLRVDETAALARIRLPVGIMQATCDRLVPAAATLHLLEHLPRALHWRFDAPHVLLQTRPQECAAAVRDFLARSASTGVALH